jgi:hypothetical protein
MAEFVQPKGEDSVSYFQLAAGEERAIRSNVQMAISLEETKQRRAI